MGVESLHGRFAFRFVQYVDAPVQLFDKDYWRAFLQLIENNLFALGGMVLA